MPLRSSGAVESERLRGKVNIGLGARGKLHSLACWYDSCQKLANWTIDSAITSSIELTDKKEGFGSLKLTNDNVAAEHLYARPDFKNCARFFGFWLKILDPPSDFDMYIRKLKTATGHVEVFHFYVSNGTLYYRPHAYGGYWANGLDEEMATDTWYWFEIQDAYPKHRFYVNGTQRWDLTMGACDIVDYDIVEVLQTSGKTLGTILLDYWRLASVQQYPPT